MSTIVRRRRRVRFALALLASGSLLLGACSTGSTGSTASKQPAASTAVDTELAGTVTSCGPGSGKTLLPGMFTIATGSPALAPWFDASNPGNGRGFEGAVAQAVARRLGYQQHQVRFTALPSAQAFTPGPKPFDAGISQAIITGERRDKVDFSSPYYAVTQGIVALKRSAAAPATSLAALSTRKIGAAGPTSLAAVNDIMRPQKPAVSYASPEQAKSALSGGAIEALVTDFPTAYLLTTQISGSVLAGQFPRPNDVTDFFGLVLQKGSQLTRCVSAAVDSLHADGTIDQLAKQWLSDTTGAKILS